MSIIPKNLKLAGLDIEVLMDSTLYKDRKIVGEAKYPTQQILIDPSIQVQQSVSHNYCHELLHWIFYILNEDEIRTNEKLIDQAAYLLHQALTSPTEYYSDLEITQWKS